MDSALRESETSSSLLQLDDTRGLLDVVDRLRSQGISQYIDLPEIIVCGEQSSGKSSVLEAISGVMFPSKDNLCTRFATELVLRRGPATPIRIRIVPGPEERSEDDREKLRNFNVSVSSEDLKLGDVIEAAKEAMGINDLTKVFSKDILRLEISGPEQPHLTLVDLPGLFQAGSRSQSDEDSDTVKALVLSYMRRPRSIILAVVSAKNDFNNQSITRFAREIDQSGVRTLGLITKPDTLDEGSDSEKFYVQLAQNQDVKFRLGWHVLRNRDYSSRNLSMRERNDAEAQFFSCGIWQSLHPSKVGIHSLKPRLGQILKDQIIMQLPFVLSQIQNGLQDCANRMNILGPARATQMEQRRYLLRISKLFSDLIRAATEGSYSNPFFGSAASDEDYTKRLRAVLQNTLTDFAGAMSRSGHTFDILEEDHAGSPGQITRQDYLLTVRKHITRSRGRELPGTFDPLVIGDLFHEQRKPWTKLVDEYVGKVIRAVYHVVCAVLSYISDQSTSEGLLRHVIHPKLEQLTLGLQEKISEILEPYGSDHPITYNHYLTENVQKAQGTRFKREMKRSLEQFFDENGEIVAHRLNINSLVDVIVTKHEADMDDYASSYATDFMQSYYKVARKKVVDDISVLAIEARLIKQLPNLLSQETVWEIDEGTVATVTAEEETSSIERVRYIKKQEILENGLRELMRMQGHPTSAHDKESALLHDSSSGTTTPKRDERISEDGSSEPNTTQPSSDLNAPADEYESAPSEAHIVEQPHMVQKSPTVADIFTPFSSGETKSKKKTSRRF